MTVYVFTGPTLAPEAARGELDAVYLPPVSQGDVYRVSLRRPRAIGIIDGYFERVPAVWHKEILWAMREGIHVFGSASMGALRAAELAPFGMEGVGAVFAAYRDGVLTDDDEVTVAHGTGESGYAAQSEAMVNIRATLGAAAAVGVIRPAVRAALEQIAKGLFYPERSYPLVLRRAAAAGLPEEQLDALRAWLPVGRRDQKRDDAIAMLRRMRERLADGPGPKRVSFHFEYTDLWDEARRRAGEIPLDGSVEPEMLLLDAVLEELRLDPDAYDRARSRALTRLLALREAQWQAPDVAAEHLRAMIETFRYERDLLEPAQVEQWLTEHHLSADQFVRLMEDEARLRWVETLAQREVVHQLLDHLRVSGDLPHLLARARDKRRRLGSRGLTDATPGDAGMTADGLLRWYFEERLGRPVVADLGRFIQAAGFTNETEFRQALLREFWYVGAGPRR
jgi:hypothetical protein